MSLRDRIEAAHRGEAALPLGLGPVLSMLSVGQSLGMALRRLQPPQAVDARVISFGNITAGGTGKTPAVIERAEQELRAGNRVAVITRGYGSERTEEPLLIAPDDTRQDLDLLLGDEPALIRRRISGSWIVKSANRVAGARAAVEQGCNVLLLDDGFQSIQLRRDEDVVLMDAACPVGNGHLLPRGPLREAPSALGRATEVWLTRCDHAVSLNAAIELVTRYHGKRPIRLTRHAATGLWRLIDGEAVPLQSLQGQPIHMACAIARPQEFERTLRELGATITGRTIHPDHRRFDASLLPREIMVITTEKDAVRLRGARDNVHALAISLVDF